MSIKLDVLAFAAHPDDVEMSCGGTIIKLVQSGKKVGIVDITLGELGTRGTPETRKSEAAKAAELMQLAARENLELEDGRIGQSEEEISKVIMAIRKYRPDIILANAMEDRHPDHGSAAALIEKSVFLAGLKKYPLEGEILDPWRPRAVYHYIQDRYIEPDFVVDITEQYEKRKQVIACFESQFYKQDSKEEETYISTKKFQDYLEARAVSMGHKIGVHFGEGFTSVRTMGVSDITSLI